MTVEELLKAYNTILFNIKFLWLYSVATLYTALAPSNCANVCDNDNKVIISVNITRVKEKDITVLLKNLVDICSGNLNPLLPPLNTGAGLSDMIFLSKGVNFSIFLETFKLCFVRLLFISFMSLLLQFLGTNILIVNSTFKVTKNGVGYIKITDEIQKEFGMDAASTGNMIGELSYVNELLTWVTFSEDKKQNMVRVSIRSRGPVINTLAMQYNGGGHKLASGIRLPNFDLSDEIIDELDKVCKEYIEGCK